MPQGTFSGYAPQAFPALTIHLAAKEQASALPTRDRLGLKAEERRSIWTESL